MRTPLASSWQKYSNPVLASLEELAKLALGAVLELVLGGVFEALPLLGRDVEPLLYLALQPLLGLLAFLFQVHVDGLFQVGHDPRAVPRPADAYRDGQPLRGFT